MSRRRRSDKNKANYIVIALLVVILILVGVIGFLIGKDRGNKEDESLGSTEPLKQVEVPETQITEPEAESETFVIFGVDSRTNQLGSGTRSDSIMIVYVDHVKKTVKVASVYRDCMVRMEDRAYQKITHAHQFGGPEYAVEVINDNFDLEIEKYVTVNFNSLSKLVDLIGGIEYTITDSEAGQMGYSSGGTYLLDGDGVVAYSRIRKLAGGDYKRSERQRDMLFKIFEKSKTLDTATGIEVVEEMLDNVNTNYSQDEILVMLYQLSKYQIGEMTAFPQVFYGGYVEEAWVEVPCTLIDMNAAMHEFLYGETDYVPSAEVEEYSAVMRSKVDGPNHDFSEDE